MHSTPAFIALLAFVLEAAPVLSGLINVNRARDDPGDSCIATTTICNTLSDIQGIVTGNTRELNDLLRSLNCNTVFPNILQNSNNNGGSGNDGGHDNDPGSGGGNDGNQNDRLNEQGGLGSEGDGDQSDDQGGNDNGSQNGGQGQGENNGDGNNGGDNGQGSNGGDGGNGTGQVATQAAGGCPDGTVASADGIIPGDGGMGVCISL